MRLEKSVLADDRSESLSKEEILRYSRNMLLPQFGVAGQKKLKAAKVLIVGTGGLGAPLALYLAAAGVGTLGIVDYDYVEESNLQRQIIHSTRDVDRPKVASASDRIKALNPNVNVVAHNTSLSSENALPILEQYDIVCDGTDNFATRYLINDAAVFLGMPVVYGSVFQYEGQATVFNAQNGPCYRCLYPTPPPPGLVPSCSEGGVLGVVPGIVGTIQANEAIKLIAGGGDSLAGRLLLIDSWDMTFRQLKIAKDAACPVCGERATITELIDYEEFCGTKPKEGQEPIGAIWPKELKERIDRGDALQLIDIREPHERALAPFPGAKYIPLGQMERRVGEFDPSVDAVFLCKVGQRSVYAIQALREAGYKGKMYNLKDGINGWARDVDAALPII
jgi:adenylyltransferase/sulfurtransferase